MRSGLKRGMLTVMAVVMALSLSFLPVQAAKQTLYGTYIFNWDHGAESYGMAIEKDGVIYVEVNSMVLHAGLKIVWDDTKQRAAFYGENKKFAVRRGQDKGVLDGHNVAIDGKPFMVEEYLFIPLNFILKALDSGTTEVYRGEGSISPRVQRLKSYHKFTPAVGTPRQLYMLNENGDLLITDMFGRRVSQPIPLGIDNPDQLQIQVFSAYPGVIIQVVNNYGEPHINYDVYTLVMVNGGVQRKSKAQYVNRFEMNDMVTDTGMIGLTDGRTLRMIELGSVIYDVIDLTELGGEDDAYFVEWIGDAHLLIRANGNGILTLVDLSTGEKVELYRELLSPEEQEYVEQNDTPYRGDQLKLQKSENGILTIEDRSSGKVYEYEI